MVIPHLKLFFKGECGQIFTPNLLVEGECGQIFTPNLLIEGECGQIFTPNLLIEDEFCLIFTLVGMKMSTQTSFRGEPATVSHACYKGEGTISQRSGFFLLMRYCLLIPTDID